MEANTRKKERLLPVGLVWVHVDLVTGTGVDTEDVNHLNEGGRDGGR